MNAITPGPWHFRPENNSVEAQMKSGYSILIAECAGSASVPPKQARDNARLMAASPDLLTAARQLVATCDLLVSGGVQLPISIVDCYESAKDAIQRVETT